MQSHHTISGFGNKLNTPLIEWRPITASGHLLRLQRISGGSRYNEENDNV